MTLKPEDPRLSAYLLGELSADEAAAVQRAVAADPALGIALKELEATQTLLVDTLAPSTSSSTLLPRQRAAILQAARHADQGGKVTPLPARRPTLKAFLIPLAAAAAIVPLVIILTRVPPAEPIASPKPEPPPAGELPLEVALFPAPGPPDAAVASTGEARPTAAAGHIEASRNRAAAVEANGDLFLRKVAERLAGEPPPKPEQLPLLRTRNSVSAASQPSLDLPVHAGRSSLGWIAHDIRTEKRLPARESVRLEEILNHFPLRPAGAAAICRGATLSTELIPCPWKPSAKLLVVSFRGAAAAACEVTARFEADPSAVNRYRLLGFATIPGLPPARLPSRLPAGSITTIVLEIEPLASSANLGSIAWTVDSQAAPAVSVQFKADAEPSDDARFAALVCTFAQWLSGDTFGIIDGEMIAALARETVSENLTADRVDFLNLIDQSLAL